MLKQYTITIPLKKPWELLMQVAAKIAKEISLALLLAFFFFFPVLQFIDFAQVTKSFFLIPWYNQLLSDTVWILFFFFPKGLATGETAGWKRSIIPQELQFFFCEETQGAWFTQVIRPESLTKVYSHLAHMPGFSPHNNQCKESCTPPQKIKLACGESIYLDLKGQKHSNVSLVHKSAV